MIPLALSPFLLALAGSLPLLAPEALAQDPPTTCLQVTVEGVRNDQGVVIVAVFNREQAYQSNGPTVAQAHVPASTGKVVTRLCGLYSGAHVVSTFHDEDQDDSLDMRLGVPIEGFGFSGAPPLLAGKPKFDAISFQVIAPGPDRGETVTLRYLF